MACRQLEKQLFELKFAAKSLERNSKKSTRLEGEERQKVKRAMEKGNLEGARIHAEAAIRHRNESLHLLQLSNRVDAMASQLSNSMSMKNVNASMEKVVQTLCKAIEGEKLVEMTQVMDDFERQMENAAVQSACMDAALSSTTALTTPPEQVTALLQQVADEHGVEISQSLTPIPNNNNSNNAMMLDEEQQKKLSERLAKLRN